MAVCKNCMSVIEDLRRETRCYTCNAPLHKGCAINEGQYYCDVCYTVLQEEEASNNSNITIPDVIRRSYIETYAQCPFKFYMEVIKGMEAPPNIYSQLGIDIHKLVDKLCNNPSYQKGDMLYDFKQIWDNYDTSLFDDNGLKDRMYERAINSIDNIYKIIAEMPRPLCTERQIIFPVGDDLPQVSATIDRIDKQNGELEVHDWKTGAVMVGQKLSSDLQAPLYIYAARQKYEAPVKRFTFHYLQDGKQRVFERVSGDDYVCTVKKREYHINITDVIRKVQSIFAKIKKGLFNIPKDVSKMYFTCKVCHIREMEACQGAELESWRQYNKGG